MTKELYLLQQQTIALAGVAQAARIVDQVARTGSFPEEFLRASLHSLFTFDAEDVGEVFGSVAGVKLGLHNLCALLANRQGEENREIVRYVFALLYLERKFSADAAMMSVVHSRLQHASFKSTHFSDDPAQLCHSVAAIYEDTLSKLRFRIRVSGSSQHLEDKRNADIVRALLLAGIRSAYLWRQLGGRRWKLALQRRRVLHTCQELSRDLGVV